MCLIFYFYVFNVSNFFDWNKTLKHNSSINKCFCTNYHSAIHNLHLRYQISNYISINRSFSIFEFISCKSWEFLVRLWGWKIYLYYCFVCPPVLMSVFRFWNLLKVRMCPEFSEKRPTIKNVFLLWIWVILVIF